MTDRAEAREISCSLERPPWITATRSRSANVLTAERAHRDRHDAARRRLRLGLVEDVGNRHLLGALGDLERHDRSLDNLFLGGRVLPHHAAGPLAGKHL